MSLWTLRRAVTSQRYGDTYRPTGSVHTIHCGLGYSIICTETTFSITFERNDRLEIGRKLLNSMWSRLSFFNTVFNIACLSLDGNSAVCRDELTIRSITGFNTWSNFVNSWAGIGSSLHDFFANCCVIGIKSSNVISLNCSNLQDDSCVSNAVVIVLRVAFCEAVGTLSTSSATYMTLVLARFANILSSQKQKAWANEAVINFEKKFPFIETAIILLYFSAIRPLLAKL